MSKTTSNPQSAASSMAELMAKHTAKALPTLHKGDMVKGVITKLTPSEMLIDIQAKTEAVVLEKEKPLVRLILKTLKVGDTVTVQVLNPESDTGNPIVSLRRYLDRTSWEELAKIQKDGQKFDVTVTGVTKGGYLVATPQGIDAFLPNSHLAHSQPASDMVGKKLSVMIAEQNPETRKLIVSQKQILGQKDFDDLIKTAKVGTKVDAIVSHITTFGMFVNIVLKSKKDEDIFLDGFVHISEVAWEKVSDLSDLFEVGQAIEAVVLKIDLNTKRIDLSIKKLTEDPFQEAVKAFPLEKKVRGTVTRISEMGVNIDLGIDGIEGFIRKEKIPVGTTYKEGQTLELTVSELDSRKHRIVLAPILLDKPLMYR